MGKKLALILTLLVAHLLPSNSFSEPNIVLTMPPILAATKDRTPDPFSFPAKTDVARSVYVVSDTITVSGIDVTVPISINGGAYSINNGAFTSSTGFIENGQTVKVRVFSSSSYSTSTSANLSIGGIKGTFTVTTLKEPDDPAPNQFSFPAKTNVAINTLIYSNIITVSGINVPSPISITGGTYSINDGAFTSNSGVVRNGQTVQVRVRSSSSFTTTTGATLAIGGVSRTFRVTTVGPTTILPNHTSYVDSIDYFNIVGEIRNNTTHHLRFVKINANLFNSNGRLIDTDFTYIWLDNLPPGEKTCFELSFSNSTGASYYRFESPTYRTDGTPWPNLSIYNHSGSYDSRFGWYEILGFVRNNSNRQVTYVTPVGTVYNGAGKVIGCDFTYVNSTDLAAGQSSAFNLTFLGRDYSDVASYRLQVDGN